MGTTGSGKTQAALFHLSHRDFDKKPWVILNWKRDESIDGIPYARDMELNQIPTLPGIYIAHPLPDDDSAVAGLLWAIWHKGNIGLYVDEGYMIGKKESGRAFRALLTQGRSKHIPMVVLTQRPVWMDRFVLSESEFFQVFRLVNRKDRRAVEEFIPMDSMPRDANGIRLTLDTRLPEYHSWYFDATSNKTVIVSPVPDIDTIHGTFERRLNEIERRRKKVV